MITNNINWKTVDVGGVKISVRPRPKTPYTVLRVTSLVDTGNGSQMAVLKNALPREWEIDIDEPQKAQARSKKGLSLPRRIANLNCVYTGRSFGVVADVMESLRVLTRNARIAAIVPDIIAPGDFVVFRYEGSRLKIRFAGVLRAVTADF
ncbi:MAG: hypothetical protein IT559_07140 [Alphaproteobacteria bacterium]|nr:hypothetical protein [Alphaproteobacteria bacterium]